MEFPQTAKKGGRYRLAAAWLILVAIVLPGRAQRMAEPKGELRFEGTQIARIILARDDGHVEEWTNLSGTIEIPAGSYQVRLLTLKGDYPCQPGSLAALGPIEISPEEPAVLKAGGPLEQTITVNRQGRTLVLGYGLRGIGDEEYQSHSAAHAKFTAYQGQKAIATGAFEYG